MREHGAAACNAHAPAPRPDGRASQGSGCTGDPSIDTAHPTPAGAAPCLTQAELDVLTAWVAGGEPE